MTALPPPPDFPPTAGLPVEWWRPAPVGTSGGRLPDWRDLVKPTTEELTAPSADPEPEAEQPAEPEGEQPAEEPAPFVGPHEPVHYPPPAAPTARARLTRHQRVVLYTATAVTTGWAAGAAPWCLQLMTYYGHGNVGDGLTAGAICVAAALPLDMYAHRWRGGEGHALLRALGWAARIPLASAVLALLLYTPDATF